METAFLFTLTTIFIIESIFEVRYYAQVRTIFLRPGRAVLNKRVARIIKVENMWSWGSWILLILMFILPERFTFLLICVITLIETWVVYELRSARNYAERINK
ncbi:hypothetical protein KZE55_05255 [Limosilactobacillus panis]|uniref:hypothetical protein n=1 Tax=Limosilactobacillus panis TaxID=47493 RepID=UPI001C9460F5|nr:hypothetical protein [Limosilactobacillus panis]QZN92244.1 hypothetical protein KZE55_05255 [Limosilactobacillus panis]